MFSKQPDAFQQILTASKHLVDFKRCLLQTYCSKTEGSIIGNESHCKTPFFAFN